MTEGMEELSAGPVTSPGSTSPTGSTVDTGVPVEKPEEREAAVESGEEGAEATAEGGGGDGEHVGAVGVVALPGSCCVCVEMEQINSCLHSEKICILPILACLLSLALCTAGLKWVFVDKIFEYNPPTHLDPKPIGQDPVIISVDPTQGRTVSSSGPSASTAIAVTPGRPGVSVENKPSPESPRASGAEPSVTLRHNAERPTVPQLTTQESNDIIIPTISATSTTTTARTSSHVTRCSDSQKNYCVNGGECFTLEIMPGSTKFLCRCPNEFTGDRCQNYVMASFYKAEELYQKRILTITGICIALLVVGIMCVVAYCKTKKQRKKLHHRLRLRLQNKRKSNPSAGAGHSSARGRRTSNLPLQDLQLNTQCNGTVQPAAEKETETTFSTSKYDVFAHEPTSLPHISSQRFVSAGTSRCQLSPVCPMSPATPGSPPSEASAPLSSLALSVPSVALSPSGEEECPLLLSKRSSSRDEQKRKSAHYNHGHVAHSLPPSPLFTEEKTNHRATADGDAKASSHGNTSSIDDCSNRSAGAPGGFVLHNAESSGNSMLVRGTDEPQGECPHVLAGSPTAQLPGDDTRTNPEPPGDEPSSSTTKPDPGAV